MDPGGPVSDVDVSRPWLAPIVPPPPPRPRRRRPWIVAGSLVVVAVAIVVGLVISSGDDAEDDPLALATVLREAGNAQAVTMTRRVTVGGVTTFDEEVVCDVIRARCRYDAIEGMRAGTFIVDGIELVVWMDPVYLRSVGGPDTGESWGVVPLREVTDAELRSFGQSVLFDGFARAVRLGKWLDQSVQDGVATQRIVVTADDLALSDTTEEFLGFVSYLDVMEITFVYDRERLLGFTLEYDSANGPVTEETTILRFDGESAIPVPEDAVPVPASLFVG